MFFSGKDQNSKYPFLTPTSSTTTLTVWDMQKVSIMGREYVETILQGEDCLSRLSCKVKTICGDELTR